ncbi:3-hydroxyisobutyrate dehydrogenase [Nesidiocoris tenuis]|nr:3-hydroxyisobutyrate dehydrogenase [Nesidiocoris tenuis]
MSMNLLKNGFELEVSDLNEAACQQMSNHGAIVVKDCKQMAGEVDCLISMLPSSKEVLSLYIDGGIVNSLQPGTTVIDCSTIDPGTANFLTPIFNEVGTSYLDAPVSGGIIAAENASLTFMAGGEADDIERVKPVLLSMGKNVIHCGPTGSGLIAKVCNNLLLGITMIGVSEAMNIGVKLGLRPEILAHVLNMSSGRCWSSDTYNPVPGVLDGVPSSNNYKPGFTVKMITKDLKIAEQAAKRSALPFELGGKTLAVYEHLANGDFGEKDFSIVYQYLKEKP